MSSRYFYKKFRDNFEVRQFLREKSSENLSSSNFQQFCRHLDKLLTTPKIFSFMPILIFIFQRAISHLMYEGGNHCYILFTLLRH